MMEVYDDKVVIGFSPDRGTRRALEWLEEGQLMPLNDFLTFTVQISVQQTKFQNAVSGMVICLFPSCHQKKGKAFSRI